MIRVNNEQNGDSQNERHPSSRYVLRMTKNVC